MRGYFTGMMSLTKIKNVKVEETECTFKGGKYHKYVAR